MSPRDDDYGLTIISDVLTIKMPPRGSYGSWPFQTSCQPQISIRLERGGVTYFLFGLKALDDRGKLAEHIVRLLVVLDLSANKL
jgi:hypothetical protein